MSDLARRYRAWKAAREQESPTSEPDYTSLVKGASEKHGIDPDLAMRVMNVESAGKPRAVSPKGALGLFQVMPGTAQELGYQPSDMFDPEKNIDAGLRYLKQQMDRFGDPELALAAYNAGPGAVQKYGGVPPYEETQQYVGKTLGYPQLRQLGEPKEAPPPVTPVTGQTQYPRLRELGEPAPETYQESVGQSQPPGEAAYRLQRYRDFKIGKERSEGIAAHKAAGEEQAGALGMGDRPGFLTTVFDAATEPMIRSAMGALRLEGEPPAGSELAKTFMDPTPYTESVKGFVRGLTSSVPQTVAAYQKATSPEREARVLPAEVAAQEIVEEGDLPGRAGRQYRGAAGVGQTVGAFATAPVMIPVHLVTAGVKASAMGFHNALPKTHPMHYILKALRPPAYPAGHPLRESVLDPQPEWTDVVAHEGWNMLVGFLPPYQGFEQYKAIWSDPSASHDEKAEAWNEFVASHGPGIVGATVGMAASFAAKKMQKSALHRQRAQALVDADGQLKTHLDLARETVRKAEADLEPPRKQGPPPPPQAQPVLKEPPRIERVVIPEEPPRMRIERVVIPEEPPRIERVVIPEETKPLGLERRPAAEIESFEERPAKMRTHVAEELLRRAEEAGEAARVHQADRASTAGEFEAPPPKPEKAPTVWPPERKPAPEVTQAKPAPVEIAAEPAPPPPEAPKATRLATGKSGTVKTPAGDYEFTYEIVPHSEIVASHEGIGFTKEARYPAGLQERPYHRDTSEQGKVARNASRYDPRFIVTDVPDTLNGPPVLATDANVVLGGNSRQMTHQRVVKGQARPGALQDYYATLMEKAEQFGLNSEQVAAMVARGEHPVLVRRLKSVPVANLDAAREAGRRFNLDFKQAVEPVAAAVSRARNLPEEALNQIGEALAEAGPDATLKEALRSGPVQRRVIGAFVKSGVIPETEISRYVETRTGAINDAGFDMIERTLAGLVVPDADLLSVAPKSAIAKIVKAIQPLIQTRLRGGEWDLTTDMSAALELLVKARQAEVKYKDYADQAGLFGETPTTARARELAQALDAMKPRDFVNAAREYAESAAEAQKAEQAASPRARRLKEALDEMKPTAFTEAIRGVAREAERDIEGQPVMPGFDRPRTPSEAMATYFGGKAAEYAGRRGGDPVAAYRPRREPYGEMPEPAAEPQAQPLDASRYTAAERSQYARRGAPREVVRSAENSTRFYEIDPDTGISRNAEREALIRSIIRDEFAKHPPVEQSGKQRVVAYGGGWAAGRLSAEKGGHAGEATPIRVSAGSVMERLPEYAPSSALGGRSTAYRWLHEEAGAIANRMAREAAERGLSFTYDSTADNVPFIRSLLETVQGRGGTTSLVWVWRPLADAAQVAAARPQRQHRPFGERERLYHSHVSATRALLSEWMEDPRIDHLRIVGKETLESTPVVVAERQPGRTTVDVLRPDLMAKIENTARLDPKQAAAADAMTRPLAEETVRTDPRYAYVQRRDAPERLELPMKGLGAKEMKETPFTPEVLEWVHKGAPVAPPELFAPKSEAALSRAFSGGPDVKGTTADFFGVDWDTRTAAHPGRERMIQRIVKFLHLRASKPPPGEQPTLYLTMGGLAAGKSTARTRLVKRPAVESDTDQIKFLMPEWGREMERGNYDAAATVHQETSIISLRAAYEGFKKGLDVVYDSTGRDPSVIEPLLKAAREAGYTTRAIYVDTPVETAYKWFVKRAEATGRMHRPRENVYRAHQQAAAAFLEYWRGSDLLDIVEVVANREGKPPTRVFKRRKAGEVIAHPSMWKEVNEKAILDVEATSAEHTRRYPTGPYERGVGDRAVGSGVRRGPEEDAGRLVGGRPQPIPRSRSELIEAVGAGRFGRVGAERRPGEHGPAPGGGRDRRVDLISSLLPEEAHAELLLTGGRRPPTAVRIIPTEKGVRVFTADRSGPMPSRTFPTLKDAIADIADAAEGREVLRVDGVIERWAAQKGWGGQRFGKTTAREVMPFKPRPELLPETEAQMRDAWKRGWGPDVLRAIKRWPGVGSSGGHLLKATKRAGGPRVAKITQPSVTSYVERLQRAGKIVTRWDEKGETLYFLTEDAPAGEVVRRIPGKSGKEAWAKVADNADAYFAEREASVAPSVEAKKLEFREYLAKQTEKRERNLKRLTAMVPDVEEPREVLIPATPKNQMRGDRLLIFHKIPRAEGGVRVTTVYKDGPSGHTEHNTLADALKEYVYSIKEEARPAPGTVDRWSLTPEWEEGIRILDEVNKWSESAFARSRFRAKPEGEQATLFFKPTEGRETALGQTTMFDASRRAEIEGRAGARSEREAHPISPEYVPTEGALPFQDLVNAARAKKPNSRLYEEVIALAVDALEKKGQTTFTREEIRQSLKRFGHAGGRMAMEGFPLALDTGLKTLVKTGLLEEVSPGKYRIGDVRQQGLFGAEAADKAEKPPDLIFSFGSVEIGRTPGPPEKAPAGAGKGPETLFARPKDYRPREVQPNPSEPAYSPPQSGPERVEVKGRNDILSRLSKALKVPVWFGRSRKIPKDARAGFVVKPEIVLAVMRQDISAVAHEMGHYVEKKVYGKPLVAMKEAELSRIPEALREEWRRLSESQEVPSLSEGLAESIRLLVEDPEALARYPEASRFIAGVVGRELPEALPALREAQADYRRLMEAPVVAQFLAEMDFNPEKPVPYSWDKFYAQTFDDLHHIRAALDTLAKGDPVAASIYEQFRTFRGWKGTADAWLEYARNTFADPLAKSGLPLKDILEPVMGNYKDFAAYATARRATERIGKGYPMPWTAEQARQTRATLERPEFARAFDQLQQYQDALIQYVADAGGLSKDQLAAIRTMSEEYVPLYRVMTTQVTDGPVAGKGLGRRFVNLFTPIKRMVGSRRKVVDPIESVFKNTLALIHWAEANAVTRDFFKFVESKEGWGRLLNMRRLDPKLRPTKVDVAEVLKQAGLEGMVPLEDGKTVTIFRADKWGKQPNEVTYWDEGKIVRYEVPRELRSSLEALDRDGATSWVRILQHPASWLRAGATLVPGFILRNPLRDQLTAYTYSRYGFTPGVDLVRGVFSALRKDEHYWNFRRSGAAYSELVSLDRNYLRKNLKELMESKTKRRMRALYNPLYFLRSLSRLGEEATRLMEVRRGLVKEAAAGLEGRTLARKAGYAGREVTLDFNRIGAKQVSLNQIAAFYNAGLQGWDKMARQFKQRPFATSARVAAGVTLPSMLLYLVNRDEDWYKDLEPWERDLFWHMKIGDTIYRYPKPFEVGLLFGSYTERAMAAAERDDPHVWDGALEQLLRMVPSPMPTAVAPVIENITGFSFFYGGSLVPETQKELPAQYQYGPYTSETAKAVGRLPVRMGFEEGISPYKVENILRGYFGGMGTGVTRMGEEALGVSAGGARPAKTVPERFLPGLVSPYPAARSAPLREFYEDYERARKAEKTLRELPKRGELEEHAEVESAYSKRAFLAGHYRKYAAAMSKISREMQRIAGDKSLTGQQKRDQINALVQERNALARDANRAMHEAAGAP